MIRSEFEALFSGVTISYAEKNEDIILNSMLKSIKNGFYVDVGASHPTTGSFTKLFYDKGWRGINIDPRSDLIESYAIKRPRDINLCCAASDSNGSSQIFIYRGSSTMDSKEAERVSKEKGFIFVEEKVIKRTLDDILLEYIKNDAIHFLKIDVEHHEKEVLSGLTLSIYRPWVMVIESYFPHSNVAAYHEWENKLFSNGYSYVTSTGLNRFYAANEKKDMMIVNIIESRPVNFLSEQKHNELWKCLKTMSMASSVLSQK